MHGLIFETSICYWQDQPGNFFHNFPFLCFNLCEYPACPSLADRKSKGPSQPEEKGHPRPPVVRRKTEKGTYVSKKTREIKPEHRKNGVEEFRSQNLRYESGHTPT